MTTKDKILKLLSNGKERTRDEIQERLSSINPDDVAHDLTSLTYARKLVSDQLPGGFMTYRIAEGASE